jgi:hypothetical protein
MATRTKRKYTVIFNVTKETKSHGNAWQAVASMRMATFGQCRQKAWPFLAEKLIGKLLCLGGLVQFQKGVVAGFVRTVPRGAGNANYVSVN